MLRDIKELQELLAYPDLGVYLEFLGKKVREEMLDFMVLKVLKGVLVNRDHRDLLVQLVHQVNQPNVVNQEVLEHQVREVPRVILVNEVLLVQLVHQAFRVQWVRPDWSVSRGTEVMLDQRVNKVHQVGLGHQVNQVFRVQWV